MTSSDERVNELVETMTTPESERRFSGIGCGDGGCHPLSHDDAKALWDLAMKQKAERQARIPDEATAIRSLFEAFITLKEMGWRDAIYAPKGPPLEVIEVGSTGIHFATRDQISFWIHADGDSWPSRPVLFRLAEPAALNQPAPAPAKASLSPSDSIDKSMALDAQQEG
jgi:hypothetical protein